MNPAVATNCQLYFLRHTHFGRQRSSKTSRSYSILLRLNGPQYEDYNIMSLHHFRCHIIRYIIVDVFLGQ